MMTALTRIVDEILQDSLSLREVVHGDGDDNHDGVADHQKYPDQHRLHLLRQQWLDDLSSPPVDSSYTRLYRKILIVRQTYIAEKLALHEARTQFQRARDHLRMLDENVINEYLSQDHPFLPPAHQRRANGKARALAVADWKAWQSAITETLNGLDYYYRCERFLFAELCRLDRLTQQPQHFVLFKRFYAELAQQLDDLVLVHSNGSRRLAEFDREKITSAPPQSIVNSNSEDDDEVDNDNRDNNDSVFTATSSGSSSSGGRLNRDAVFFNFDPDVIERIKRDDRSA